MKLLNSIIKSQFSDFSALLLEQTNSKVSPYYALLTEVLHKASVDKKRNWTKKHKIADDFETD